MQIGIASTIAATHMKKPSEAKTPEATLLIPSTIREGDARTNNSVLALKRPADKSMTFVLHSDPADELTMPTTVRVPAGKRQVVFAIQATPDHRFDGNKTVTVMARSGNSSAAAQTFTLDSDVARLSLTLPATVAEGGFVDGVISMGGTVLTNTTVTVSSTGARSPYNFPFAITVGAGQSGTSFRLAVTDNVTIDPDAAIIVTATADGFGSASAPITITDNDPRSLSIVVPSFAVEGTSVTASIRAVRPVSSPIIVDLTSSDAATASVPASIIIPAGADSVSFSIVAVDDASINGDRAVTIKAHAQAFPETTAGLMVRDNDVLSLTLPNEIAEGSEVTAIVSIGTARADSVTVNLSGTDVDHVVFPASINIPPGQNSAAFTLSATENAVAEGNRPVQIVANADGFSPVSRSLTVLDNEIALGLNLPSTMSEGTVTNGVVTLSHASSGSLVISLQSSDASALDVPATVVVPAGATSAPFQLTARENDLRTGPVNVQISAGAEACFGASNQLSIRDNDVASYRVSLLSDIINISAPVSLRVAATDVQGNVIDGYSGDVTLSLLLPDGSSGAISPSTVFLSGPSGWSGSINVPLPAVLPARIRVQDENGNLGDSALFDILRSLPLKTADAVWDSTRNRIYASVPASASGPYANQVVSIDPESNQIVASLPVGSNPQKLALTSAGEFLYVALDANGSVAQVNPENMTVLSSFTVGSDPFPDAAPFSAEDMCTVAGYPEQLIVSGRSKTVSVANVAAYDHGVMRPKVLVNGNRIESSASANVFFAFDRMSTESDFRRLQLDATGLTQLTYDRQLIVGFNTEIRADGDTVFSSDGRTVDGLNMVALGRFSLTNPAAVCPDLARNRVYYVDTWSGASGAQSGIVSFDPRSRAELRRLTLPAPIGANSFFRWGTNGLAVGNSSLNAESFLLINSSRLVPSDPPADLAVNVTSSADPAWSGETFQYFVDVTNHGVNVARDVRVGIRYSTDQYVTALSSTKGVPTFNSSASGSVDLPIVDLAPGETVRATLTTRAGLAGRSFCQASVSSSAIDLDQTNNFATNLINVGFRSTAYSVATVRLGLNNLVYDSTRNLLWGTVAWPSTGTRSVADLPEHSIVAVDPTTGLISDPIALNDLPMERSIAIAPNGAYLYVGLATQGVILRVDLASPTHPIVRIPFENVNQNGNGVQDIEVLDGDGTSFVAVGRNGRAAVFDGTTSRPTRTALNSVSFIGKTANQSELVGSNNNPSPPANTAALIKLALSASGISVTQTDYNLAPAYYVDLTSAGDIALTTTGQIIDSTTFTLVSTLGLSGGPCVDVAKGHVFLVSGGTMRAFDAATGAMTAAIYVGPGSGEGSTCTRWGVDGLAVAGGASDVLAILRWPPVAQ